MRIAWFLALSSLALVARATPVVLQHSGFVLTGADAPLDSNDVPFTFRVATQATPPGGAETFAWESGACDVDVKAGYYAVALSRACGAGLEAEDVEVAVTGVALRPRHRLASTPVASTALALGAWPAADDVRATQLGTGGDVPVAWARITGVPTGIGDGDDGLLAVSRGATLAAPGRSRIH